MSRRNVFRDLLLKDYITLLGLMFGVSVIVISILGLILSETYWIPFAALMWSGAMVCDLFDGMVARWLNQSNEIGKEIDSLADAISFTVAPGILILCASLETPAHAGEFMVFVLPREAVMIGVFILVFLGVTRLAWYNVANVGEGYTGITTPMTAAFVICFYLSHHYFQELQDPALLPGYYHALSPISNFFSNTLSVTILLIILGLSNVVTFLRYGKAVQKRRGIWKYIIIALAIVLIVTIVIGRGFIGTAISKFTIHFLTLSFIMCILGYYIYGFINYLGMKKRGET